MQRFQSWLVRLSFVWLFVFVTLGCVSSGVHASTQPTTQTSIDVPGTITSIQSITTSPEAQTAVSLLGPWGSLGLLGVNAFLSVFAAFYARKSHKVLSSSEKKVDTTAQ